VLFACVTGLIVLGYAAATVVRRSNGACTAPARQMARLELIFGLARTGGGEIPDAEWQDFLAGEVTPRFPDGLTVLEASGQWRNSAGVLGKERSRVLLVWYRSVADAETRIEAIRRAWTTRFAQESVLRSDGVDCVRF
jgi:hypothetical protein